MVVSVKYNLTKDVGLPDWSSARDICNRVFASPLVPTSFVLVGDSTTAIGSGWGNGFYGDNTTSTPSTLEPNTPCINTACGGATTGSFVAGGWWNITVNAIKDEVAKGRHTLVTIQFGHNDAGVGPPESMGANLTSMVKEVRTLGAEPILVTSLIVRNFNADGTINDSLQPASKEYCEKIGPTAAHRLNPTAADTVHLNQGGKIVFGRMVADLMTRNSFLPNLPIIANPGLAYNNTHGIAFY
ncbi:SGNH hydrolase [Desarmillaria tabescens]|uniref:SGNH hydrolase n=1 Tax=Armillaria tabescens TaxID=1929756 RepID=A0AA39NPV2_ARMTA|nr:SGNH hydrolase [Desarmillaria tabescens]KAK0469652.1 SGNH hydrolase [Desarmillaria tabescens]